MKKVENIFSYLSELFYCTSHSKKRMSLRTCFGVNQSDISQAEKLTTKQVRGDKPVVSAFTLVELAIVLVIIGLLVGGALVGQSLIASAKINSQVSQLKGYDTAIAAFRLEYDAIPGDMKYSDATAYGLTSLSSLPPNGNGVIDDYNGLLPPIDAYSEPYYVFMQLKEAKLIEGAYRTISSSFCVGIDAQFAEDKIGRGGVALISKADRKLYFFLGPTCKNDTTHKVGFYQNSVLPSFTSHEAYQIDNKIDDGVPSNGLVRAVIVTQQTSTNFSNDTTTTGSSPCLATTETYQLSNETTPACRLTVALGQ